MKNIFGSFLLAGRKERRVLNLIFQHFSLVVDTVNRLQPLFDAAKTGDWKTVEVLCGQVDELETLADGLHRDAVVAISQGAFFSGMRDDFLQLMELDDEVADAAKDAARILAELPIEPKAFLILYEEPSATLNDYFVQIQSAVNFLQESIRSLERDAETAVSKSLLVEHAEEDGDEVKNRLIRRIFGHKGDLEALSLLQLRDFILQLDEIADAAEDASDLVIAIVAKGEA
jgi:predicted phosphate transport protein (TIGR00153 family)